MKKVKLILPMLLALVLGFTMTSCESEYFGDTNTRAMTTTIEWTQWVDDGATAYLYVDVPWDAITADVLNFGNVSAYVYDGEYQCPLPYIVPITYTTATGNVVVPENITYDLSLGKISFRMQDLDGGMPEGLTNSAPITFRVVVTMPVEH
ncbi:MAG: hypothetical protein J6X79_00360 [Bacteroidales bacterium]|nr:hypothetical protein [Bacteroidales bacterium]